MTLQKLEGRKLDEGKTRLELIPPEIIFAIGTKG